MVENEILNIALENLENNAGIQGRWENTLLNETNDKVNFIKNNNKEKI